MVAASTLPDLLARARATIAVANGACDRARELSAVPSTRRDRAATVRATTVRAVAVRERQGRAHRAAAGRPAGGGNPAFAIVGVLDGEPVQARWWRVGGLACPEALRQRAEVVVALGDTFDPGDGRPPLVAAPGGDPFAVALTLLRSLDRVVPVDVATSAVQGQGASDAPG